jgi:hypothetical protein
MALVGHLPGEPQLRMSRELRRVNETSRPSATRADDPKRSGLLRGGALNSCLDLIGSKSVPPALVEPLTADHRVSKERVVAVSFRLGAKGFELWTEAPSRMPVSSPARDDRGSR